MASRSRKTQRKHHRRGGKSRRYRARGGYAGSYPEVYSTKDAGSLPAAADPSSYNDASSWILKTVGNVNTQFGNAFDQNTGNSSNGAIVGLQGQVAGRRRHRTRRGGAMNTAQSVGQLQGANFKIGNTAGNIGALQGASFKLGNTSFNTGPLQAARYKGGKRRSRRGGFLVEAALTKAALPLSILALQQSYKRKSLKI
jgi:hypothetical protein